MLAQVTALQSELPIQDAACGVKIISREGVANEFDLAMLTNNQLYLVECKTILPKGNKSIGMDVIFKLDSVSQLGGLEAEAMLVAVGVANEAEQDRADLQQLEIINGKELLNIRDRLRRWIGLFSARSAPCSPKPKSKTM